MSRPAWWAIAGAILCALAIGAGAVGAHGLRDAVTPRRLEAWQVAADYQLIHGLALLALGLGSESAIVVNAKWLVRAAFTLLIGVTVFSGSLYALVLSDIAMLGAVTPFGGVLIVVGWALVIGAFYPRRCV